MQKKFLKNLAFLIFLNLLVKPFWILGVDREVQNALGPEEYGFYFTILNFSFLFYILLDLGITNFNNRNIAQNNQLLNKHMAGISTLKILLGLYMACWCLSSDGSSVMTDGSYIYWHGWVLTSFCCHSSCTCVQIFQVCFYLKRKEYCRYSTGLLMILYLWQPVVDQCFKRAFYH